MGTIGTNVYTLADWAKRIGPDGKIAKIIDILSETNEVLEDALFKEGNLPTGHQTTVLTGQPTVTWRKLNRGIQPSKFTTIQVTDTCGMLSALAKADKGLVELNGGTTLARLAEEKPYISAMNQDLAGGIFYYDTDLTPEKFLGLAARYPYSNAPNVINNGGSGSDVTSIWLVGWGENTVHMIFPKGTKAGIQHTDVGKGEPILVSDDQTPAGEYLAFVSWWEWKTGLCVQDWRYIVRVCNVETAGDANTFDHKYLIQAYNKIPNMKLCKPAIYVNETIKTQMDIAASDSNNRFFTQVDDAFGNPVTKFWGIPVRKVDQLLNTETALVAA